MVPYRCYIPLAQRDEALEYCIRTYGIGFSDSNFVLEIRNSLRAQGVVLSEERIWTFKGYHQEKIRFCFTNKKDLFAFSMKFGVQGWQARHPDNPQLKLETTNA